MGGANCTLGEISSFLGEEEACDTDIDREYGNGDVIGGVGDSFLGERAASRLGVDVSDGSGDRGLDRSVRGELNL